MLEIRLAAPSDAATLLEIYAPYVEETSVTLENEVPILDEFSRRMASVMEFYPYLVAEEDGRILGYAYASRFNFRAAYIWTAETTVYVRKGYGGRGVGKALYSRLEQLLARQGITNLCACITHPNPASEAFHAAMGYRRNALFTNCAYKLGRWWDMVWMEKFIASHLDPPGPVVSFQAAVSKER